MAQQKEKTEAQRMIEAAYSAWNDDDIVLADQLFKQAACSDDAEALYDSGYYFEQSNDYEAALNYYRRSAEQGYAESMRGLAIFYENGYGVEKNAATAEKWYRKAADLHDFYAAYNLAEMYYRGEATSETAQMSKQIQLRYYKLSVEYEYADKQKTEESGEVPEGETLYLYFGALAASRINELLNNSPDLCTPKVAEWLEKWYTVLCDGDVAEAQYALGSWYALGGFLPQNAQKAVPLLQNSLLLYSVPSDDEAYKFDLGTVRFTPSEKRKKACDLLSDCYLNGIGVLPDAKQAAVYAAMRDAIVPFLGDEKDELWFNQQLSAAGEGDVSAQLQISSAFKQGKDVDRDDEKAFFWCKKAAEQADPEALCRLAEFYYFGQGVPKDFDRAMDLWHESAENGFEDADSAIRIYADSDKKRYNVWQKNYYERLNGIADESYNDTVVKDTSESDLKTLAESDDAMAMFTLGESHFAQKSYDSAFDWLNRFIRVAGNDLPFAQQRLSAYTMLSALYKKGLGTPKDKIKANQMKSYAKDEKKKLKNQ